MTLSRAIGPDRDAFGENRHDMTPRAAARAKASLFRVLGARRGEQHFGLQAGVLALLVELV